MRSITRGKNLIVALLLSICCLIAGLFFMEKKESAFTVSAEEVTSVEKFRFRSKTFAIEEEDIFLTIRAELTSEIAKSLSLYHPTYFYLQVECKYNGKLDSLEWFHVDPESSNLPARKLIIENNIATLRMPIPSDFTKDYTYHLSFGFYGYGNTFYYDGKYYSDYKIGDYNEIYSAVNSPVTFSVQATARNIIEVNGESLDTEMLEFANILAGYTTSSEKFTVNLVYKTVAEYGSIQTVTEQYLVNSLYKGSTELVRSELSDLKGFTGLSYFNAIYKNYADKPQEIILQARGYSYTYDDATDVGTFTIEYNPFQYKSFAVRIQGIDGENYTNLYHYIRATRYSENKGIIRIYFYYSDLISEAYKERQWLFEIEPEKIQVENNSQDALGVHVDSEKITVSFQTAKEDQLKDISILVKAAITEDYDCDVQLKYKALAFNGETIVVSEETANQTMLYSEVINYLTFSEFKRSSWYEEVTAALQVAELEGQEYFKASGITGYPIEIGESYCLEVKYEYNTLIQITQVYSDNDSQSVKFKACTKNVLTYRISDLNIAPPKGYRIQSLTSTSSDVKIEFDEEYASNLFVTVETDTKAKKIIPLTAIYAGDWNLKIVYMETYKDTPFALRTESITTIPVGKYDLNNLKVTDASTILGKDLDKAICGTSVPDRTVKTELTSESTYTATLSYGVCSLKQIDYDGNSMEIRVPLTSYVDWCNTFGDDFTILYLNTEEKKYFSYSNEVDREDLYGFFSVAVFEEQVSDWNYYFRNSTGDGNMVVFQTRELKGSKVYEFFDGMTTKGPITSLYGHVGMAFCEIINDDNKILNSYFFYMDATEGYISNGGADNADDTDGASKNWWDDIKPIREKIGNGILGVLGVAGVVAAIVGIIWLKQKLGIASAATTTSASNSSESASRPKKSKKSKKKKPAKKRQKKNKKNTSKKGVRNKV